MIFISNSNYDGSPLPEKLPSELDVGPIQFNPSTLWPNPTQSQWWTRCWPKTNPIHM